MTLNPRAFSVERYRRPEYQFARETLFLQHDSRLFRDWFHPLAVFGVFELQPVGYDAFRRTPVATSDPRVTRLGAVFDSAMPERARLMTDVCYGYTLTRENPVLAALERLTLTAERAGIRCVWYWTPVNAAQGSAIAGPAFRDAIADHTIVLAAAATRTGAVFVDAGLALGPERFEATPFPDTYLDGVGKAWLAERLAEAIRPLLEAAIVEP
jgi:hypothetical protein